MATKKKTRGRPRGLDGRFAATIACDLQALSGVSARVAAATTWETLHALAPDNFPNPVPPDSLWRDLMRHVKAGRRNRIEWLHLDRVLLEALKRLPKK